ncbi:MAG: hypothetical protein Q8904_10025 [Bacteroidota bacterium]|nr:hypothetical protein [Bacteroidota bacterium]
MEQNQSIEHVLENMDKNIVSKAKNSPFRIFLLFLSGLVFFVVNSVFVWETNSIYPPLLIVLGLTTIITGIFLLAFRREYYVSTRNHQRVKSTEVYFNVNERDKLVRLMETGNINGIKELKPSISDGLKLRVMATPDGQLCFSQVVAYVSNEYLNITNVQKHSPDDARYFAELFQQRRSK